MVTSTRALAAQGGQFGTLTSAAQDLIEQEYVTFEARRVRAKQIVKLSMTERIVSR